MLPFQPFHTHFLQGKSQRFRHHFQKTSRSGGTFVIHQEIFHGSLPVDADRFDILPANVDDSADIRIQIICALGMAGNLRDAVIPTVNVGSSISGRIDPHDLLFLNSRFLNRQIQTLLGAHHRTAAGRNNHRRFNFSILIQYDHIRTCRTAVDSRYIKNARLHLLSCLLTDTFSRIHIL